MITYRDNALHVDGVNLFDLTHQIPTPFYCYSQDRLIHNYYKFADNLENVMVCYAVKANNNICLMNLIASRGAGADVVSKGEISCALSAGIPGKRIVFSGVGKTKDEIKFALENNIYQINIESISELALINNIALNMGIKARVALRINPDVDSNTHSKIATGHKYSKFGISVKDADNILGKQWKNIEFIGFAMHIGSQITELAPFDRAFDIMRDVVGGMESRGHIVRSIDLGGGIGIGYDETVAEYCNLIKQKFDCSRYQIIIEPGRSIVGDAGILVTKILYVKRTECKNFIIVDAGMNDFMRPSMYGACHAILPARCAENNSEIFDIVGPVCESSDVFARDITMHDANEGDILVICTAGAYGFSMASTYNARPMVAEVLVYNNNFRIIREMRDFY